eukprot:14597065-Alexandrium_andersonii.AAC.1
MRSLPLNVGMEGVNGTPGAYPTPLGAHATPLGASGRGLARFRTVWGGSVRKPRAWHDSKPWGWTTLGR